MTVEENRRFCADVVSVLAMTNTEGTETLKYRLQGSHEEIGKASKSILNKNIISFFAMSLSTSMPNVFSFILRH